MANCLSCQPVAIESLWLVIIVILPVEYLWLCIIAVLFINCQGHEIEVGSCFYFTNLKNNKTVVYQFFPGLDIID